MLQCILAMSDLQIITGISILISGFIQLHQGLSSYHWTVIVDLAWFSSLTHMACLTLLKNYLYNHPLQRAWRLLSMAGLAILLVIAISFTGSYKWPYSIGYFISVEDSRTITIPAICQTRPTSRSGMPYWSMVFSIVMIIFGFMTRIIKLHRTISVNVIGTAGDWLSSQLLCLLRRVFIWCSANSSHKSLKRTLVYRPLLAIFLEVRLILDGWSSMSLEVSSQH